MTSPLRTIRTHAALAASLAFLASAVPTAHAVGDAPSASDTTDAPDAFVLDHRMGLLTGGEQDLAAFQGKVVLIVNTASRCGLTGQYEGLQALYERKGDEGFVILGFPANNFRDQEPGTNDEIAEFCEKTYGVTFPMFAKVSVKGDDICPLYRELTTQPAPVGGEIRWNFDKFLVDRSGRVVARFDPRTQPDDPALLAKIDELLTRRD